MIDKPAGIGGSRGSRKTEALFFGSYRPRMSDVEITRQLVRGYGRLSQAALPVGVSSSARSEAEGGDLLTAPETISFSVADNSSQAVTLEAAASVTSCILYYTIRRNHASPTFISGVLFIVHDGATAECGELMGVRVGATEPGITFAAQLSGADLLLVVTTDAATPAASADVVLKGLLRFLL